MHIKFIERGTGSGRSAADYFCSEYDSKNIPRPEIKVLRGDPFMVATVADALRFIHKYTSGVIGWSVDDQPSDSQISEVLDDFENIAWAGLGSDRYCWSAILHRESKGGCHVHIFAARVDLQSGKSLNIAAPGWVNSFGPLRDYFNHLYGWARPDDPSRGQDVRLPKSLRYLKAAKIRKGEEVGRNIYEDITNYLRLYITAKEIQDRGSLLDKLQQIKRVKIVKTGKDFVTVFDERTTSKYRLKGKIYEESWTAESEKKPINMADPWLAVEAQEGLKRKQATRAAYNQERYDTPNEVGGLSSPSNGPLSAFLERQLGDQAIDTSHYTEPLGKIEPFDFFPEIREERITTNDRTGTEIDQIFEPSVGAVQAGARAAKQKNARSEQASASLISTSANLDKSIELAQAQSSPPESELPIKLPFLLRYVQMQGPMIVIHEVMKHKFSTEKVEAWIEDKILNDSTEWPDRLFEYLSYDFPRQGSCLENMAIEESSLIDARFALTWRIDSNGRIVFPHTGFDNLVGYEVCNPHDSDFSVNGKGGLWVTSNISAAKKIVFVSSGIDALSYAELKQEPGIAYVSIGGTLSPLQQQLITKALKNIIEKADTIIIATSDDKKGRDQAKLLKEIIPQSQWELPSNENWYEDLHDEHGLNLGPR